MFYKFTVIPRNLLRRICISLSERNIYWSSWNLLHNPYGGFSGTAKGYASHSLLHGLQQLLEIHSGGHGVGYVQLWAGEPGVRQALLSLPQSSQRTGRAGYEVSSTIEVCVWGVSEVQLTLLLSLVLVWVNVQMSLVHFVGIFSGDVMFPFAKEKYQSSVWLPSDSFLISCLTRSQYPTYCFYWLQICCISERGPPIVLSNV